MKSVRCPYCDSNQIRLEPEKPQNRNRLLEKIPFIGRRLKNGRYILTCRNCGRQTEVEI